MASSHSIGKLLDTVVAENGSDLHISANATPIIRVSGALVPLLQHGKLSAPDAEAMLREIVPEGRWEHFLKEQSIDFSYAHADGSRFRVNGYRTGGTVTIAMRLIPRGIRGFTELNLPPVLEVFSQRQQGFGLMCLAKPLGE